MIYVFVFIIIVNFIEEVKPCTKELKQQKERKGETIKGRSSKLQIFNMSKNSINVGLLSLSTVMIYVVFCSYGLVCRLSV